MRIWKYPIEKDALVTEHMILEGGKFHHVDFIPETQEAAMWFLVEPTKPAVKRVFRFYGTGQEVPHRGYLGTFITGIFVWHLYELFQGEEK